MSSWSLQPKRTLMNDANRARYSTRDPPFENNSSSPGPAAYSPRPVSPRVKGAVQLRKLLPGATERELTLSNGMRVEHLSSVGPTSYAPEFFPRTLKPSPCTPSRRTSPRFPKPVTDGERYAVEMPGPGSYVAATSPPKGAKWSSRKRSVCEPIAKEPSPQDHPHTTAKSFTPRSLSPQSLATAPTTTISRESDHFSASPPLKGPTIGGSPRHFNIHNLNSFSARERDPDYDNPPPGLYNSSNVPKATLAVSGTKGKFSSSPRKMDVVRNRSVPGPGTYASGDETFFPPL